MFTACLIAAIWGSVRSVARFRVSAPRFSSSLAEAGLFWPATIDTFNMTSFGISPCFLSSLRVQRSPSSTTRKLLMPRSMPLFTSSIA